jgi:prophage regulatory protein
MSQSKQSSSDVARLLTMREVVALVGLHRDTVYTRIREGTFPRPKKPGARASRWLSTEVSQWIESLPTMTPSGSLPPKMAAAAMRKPHGKRDHERDARVREMFERGSTFPEIADALGVTKQRAQFLVRRLGLKRPAVPPCDADAASVSTATGGAADAAPSPEYPPIATVDP